MKLKYQNEDFALGAKNDRLALSEGLNQLRSQKEKIETIKDIRKQTQIEKDKYKTHILPVIKPLEKQKINQNLLDDILKRLKSTSIHTPKF
jgi:hypothetical protein